MASNIQIAEAAIDEEHRKLGLERPGRDAALNVVMRLQLRQRDLLAMLAESLAREKELADRLYDAIEDIVGRMPE